MDVRLASCTLLLHLLILLGAFGSRGRELSTNISKENSLLRLHSMDIQEDNDHSSSPMNTHHHHHMDPSVNVFFFLDDLKQGSKMPIYFRKISASPNFLPKEKADKIPFSLASLQDLLQLFSFSRGSPQALAMEDTLRQCETEPIRGEIKTCPTSFESMVEFVEKILGTETEIKALSTSHLTKSDQSLQMYTILQPPEEVLAPKMVACHTLPYPYAVFYCHYQESESKIFKVFLRGENGDRVESVAVCHMDTSQWSHNHASFSVLGILPGSSPVCHFFPADNLVWIPTNQKTA